MRAILKGSGEHYGNPSNHSLRCKWKQYLRFLAIRIGLEGSEKWPRGGRMSGSPDEQHEAYRLLVLTEEDDEWKKDAALPPHGVGPGTG